MIVVQLQKLGGQDCQRSAKRMDGADRMGRWTSIKQRLGLKGMGCCRATWSPSSSTLTMMETLEEEHRATEPVSVVGPAAVPGMSLAMALAAERNSRAGSEGPTATSGQVKSLMTLIEETDGVDWSNRRRRMEENRGAGDSDWLCCVCMERSKGAAFIPWGHTFCRVCSREMWLNRGTCPLCSRPILEILDIY
ncbi:hypothetical protein TIFTF001_022910 [Ficus carica]|uniref:RING-type domain-containing protein n=1 Tax=Ficus carica TaxID=3494 RepID=A0AA88AU37_FICCA|nr:hypothetical protein TIFTF001_022910 [Ficus carica]